MRIFLLLFILLSGFAFGDDSYEPNDTFDQAKTVSTGSYSLYAQDDDWFKIDLTRGSLKLTMTPQSYDVNMVLYNQNGEIIASNFSDATEIINYDILIPQTYYIKIYPTSVNYTSYTLNIDFTPSNIQDDSYEPNDTFDQAKEISKGTYTLNAQNPDWFKIYLQTGTFSAVMTPLDPTVDINMALYNDKQQVVAANFSNTMETIDYDVVTPGFYYLKIEPASVYYSDYKLTINYTTLIAWEKELDLGPVRNVPVSLYDIDNDGKDEIFIATSKTLDSNLNEIRPAGLACLEDDGTLKWIKTFPAMSTPDSQTGIIYQTTSVSTAPFFSDIDSDGNIDILVGVGADTYSEAGSDVVGQPGDKGGVYALNADGTLKWYFQTKDTIGGASNTGDGRPDGVYATPVVFDIDKDGNKEVLVNSWDQHFYILDAKTGTPKRSVFLLDTIWSIPKVADIDKDGNFEALISADITQNSDAGTQTGGIFHVISPDGTQNIKGFDKFIGNPNYGTLKGKYEEQALWSSPQAADIDNDGYLEIVYGTGNFFHDDRGQYIRVWNHDGTMRYRLDTIGRTFSAPLLADINNDGYQEIIATTLGGYIYCWDHNGNTLFATQTQTYKSTSPQPIFSSPVAVDINNDGFKEIIYAQGAQVVIVDHNGAQLSNPDKREMIFESYTGTPAIADIDKDGILDIISGGTNTDKNRAVVYRWRFDLNTKLSDTKKSYRSQVVESNADIENFVKRFYKEVLGRDAEPAGLNYWSDALATGVRAGSDVAKGFIFSQEFQNRNLNDNEFVTTLYLAFFNREPDSAGYTTWVDSLAKGTTRAEVLDGFLYSLEFGNLCRSYNILPVK